MQRTPRCFTARIPVSKAFWDKARAISSTRMKVSDLFERAMEAAIAAHLEKHGPLPQRATEPLPDHKHWVYSRAHDAVYFYGSIAIGVDAECRLVGVGVIRLDQDAI